MRDRLRGMRVLIILDDIDHNEQLEELLPPPDCRLGNGSQIVITTRDEKIVKSAERLMGNCNSQGDYKARTHLFRMEPLSLENSRRLFKWHAFLSEDVPARLAHHEGLVNTLADLCARLPLALKVFGAHMYDEEDPKAWQAMVKLLQAARESSSISLDPHIEVMKSLKLSFDNLSEPQKTMFLDIVCFLLGEHEDRVKRISQDPNAAFFHLESLKQKCLVKVLSDDPQKKLIVHDILRDMGRDIVCKESVNEWEHTHLWNGTAVRSVLRKKKGTSKVRGVSLALKDGERLEISSFTGMDNLKLLVLSRGNLEGDFSYIFKELTWFQWRHCPFKCLPSGLTLEKVAVLDLTDSKIQTLFANTTSSTFKSSVDHLQLLKELNLRGCSHLKELIGFEVSELEVLNLAGCSSLNNIPESVLCPSLVYLDISNCSQIQQLPDAFGKLTALCEFNLDHTSSLRSLPESFGRLGCLASLRLQGCSNLQEIPSGSFQGLSSLLSLHLEECDRLEELPSTMANLTSLTSLTIIRCSNLRTFPGQPPIDFCKLKALKSIFLRFNRHITKLPEGFHCLPKLESLTLSNVRNLREISRLPSTLQTLDLGNCPSLQKLLSIPSPEYLRELTLCNCWKLETLTLGLEGLPKSLQQLNISGCRSLVDVPGLERCTSLQFWQLSGSGISLFPAHENGPSKIQSMVSLERLSMYGEEIPDCFLDCKETISEVQWEEFADKYVMKDIVVPYHQGQGVSDVSASKAEVKCKAAMFCFVSNDQGYSSIDTWERGRYMDKNSYMDVQVEDPENRVVLTQRLFVNRHADRRKQLHVSIFRGNHPFLATLKAGCKIRVKAISKGTEWRITVSEGSIKLMFREHELEETLEQMSRQVFGSYGGATFSQEAPLERTTAQLACVAIGPYFVTIDNHVLTLGLRVGPKRYRALQTIPSPCPCLCSRIARYLWGLAHKVRKDLRTAHTIHASAAQPINVPEFTLDLLNRHDNDEDNEADEADATSLYEADKGDTYLRPRVLMRMAWFILQSAQEGEDSAGPSQPSGSAEGEDSSGLCQPSGSARQEDLLSRLSSFLWPLLFLMISLLFTMVMRLISTK